MKTYLTRCNDDLFCDEDLFLSDLIKSFSPEGAHMKTDIKETEKEYEFLIEVPGFKKENIKISLEDKYLTVRATKTNDVKENDKSSKFIRRERYLGSYSRSFYVGNISEDQIKAKFEDGILDISIPKDSYNKKEEKKYIHIA